ncbi:MAG: SIMPL domain-containing protein [Chlamydiota bacterium]
MMKKFQTLCFLTTLVYLTQTAHAEDQKEPQIQVTGEAILMKPADQLSLVVSVITQGKDAQEAISGNADKMSEVIDRLGTLNLTNDNYKTGHYSITPIYATPPKNMPNSWNPEILGYKVSNSLNIHTDKIDLAGSIIDQVTQAGANNIEQLRFELKNPSLYRSEAITEATKSAMQDAKTLANAAGVKLDKIVSLSIVGTPQYPVYKNALMMSTRGYKQTPIESGDVEVRASVNIGYSIDY